MHLMASAQKDFWKNFENAKIKNIKKIFENMHPMASAEKAFWQKL